MSYDYAVKSVIRVVDGDTVDLVVDLGFYVMVAMRFRLLGVDTPERGQAGWTEAGIFAREWLASHEAVRITTTKADSFGRWLGRVYSPDACLNDDLLSSGHAQAYSR